ncbi:alkaline shock response membrane anchor protein AmaP [Anaeroselena agilis]|uniref:Alkaline shock response membrane anchor protein AmaP n=1 Tax=Anaeroselena agilis TaxID=3063788 RepID=A0ABU3NXV1_9FIRM|nr:alkaline shock response membrane anchor protein AmaP [Selenomonadales bacterium 4137-cl]
MGIFDRIILSIYTLLLAFLSLGVIIISLRLVSLEQLWTSISLIYGQWEAGMVAAVFLLVSIRLLLAGLRSRGRGNTIIHHNEMGDIHIALKAVENLVEKAARQVRGVRGVKVVANHSAGGLKLRIKAVISPEGNIPSVTAEIQQRVSDYIKRTVGVDLADMHIFVENISNDFKSKHRVE